MVLREGPVHRHLILIESGDVEAIHFGPKDAVHPLGRSIAEACAVKPLTPKLKTLNTAGPGKTSPICVLHSLLPPRGVFFFYITLEPGVE